MLGNCEKQKVTCSGVSTRACRSHSRVESHSLAGKWVLVKVLANSQRWDGRGTGFVRFNQFEKERASGAKEGHKRNKRASSVSDSKQVWIGTESNYQ
ncbi:hypothetical protein EBT16_14875 [bacterium]|nr:hypothetical protein [bacterium]